jgi:autoinducer 2-degrading protein
MFAVVVTFTIAPGKREAFMPLMLENAHLSRVQEPGCHQFDVATDTGHPDEVFLYELYTDSAAFDIHKASDHFRSFDAATTGLIAAKSVRTYAQVQQ